MKKGIKGSDFRTNIKPPPRNVGQKVIHFEPIYGRVSARRILKRDSKNYHYLYRPLVRIDYELIKTYGPSAAEQAIRDFENGFGQMIIDE